MNEEKVKPEVSITYTDAPKSVEGYKEHNAHLKKYLYQATWNQVDWMDWADAMHKRGYRQKKCPVCNLYAIWYKPHKGVKE